MINLRKIKKNWLNSKFSTHDINQVDYKKHFQLALINLEQNLIEERMPELQKIA